MFTFTKRTPVLACKFIPRSAISWRPMTSQSKTKKEGDISSVFNSLSGEEAPPLPERFAQVKKQYVQGNEEALTASWKRLLKELAIENKIITEQGPRVIPDINFQDLNSNPKEFEDLVRRRGVAIIRGVVPRDEARSYKTMVEDYVKANPWTKAFPAHNPAVFELYWSPAQVRARAHPNMIAAQRYLASLWHSEDSDAMISMEPLTYADRVRSRQPGDAGFALGPHSDGGSLERWEREGYGRGQVYDKIFSGKWEEYDPWESSCRLPVEADLYNGAGACSMFRMFQGWLSMSHTNPGEGTLVVNPLLQLSTAYYLLRPFFTPLKQPNVEVTGQIDPAYLDADNWVLEPESTNTIQGANPGLCQEMNTILHPHLDLANTMVNVPTHAPGDFIAWHCDTIHAVDKLHSGKSDSSVLYIPVCPLTVNNVEYLIRQRETFLSGHPGPDFPGGKGESEHSGRPSQQFLEKHAATDGLRAMGFAKFEKPLTRPGERKMIEKANSMLGFS